MAGNWKPGMPSPYPQGRPPGIAEKRARVTNAMLKDAERIAEVLSAAGLDGNVQAAALILARAVPPLKPTESPITFDLDKTQPLSKQAEAVIHGIADGKLTVEQGQRLIDSIAKLAEIRAVDELEARLAALEARQGQV